MKCLWFDCILNILNLCMNRNRISMKDTYFCNKCVLGDLVVV